MTTIEELKEVLREVQEAQARCVLDSGIVKDEHRYRYNFLVSKARSLKECIEFLEAMVPVGK